MTDFFQVVNQIARYTNSLYGRFYIELTKNIAYNNNPVIFIVLSPFLENSKTQLSKIPIYYGANYEESLCHINEMKLSPVLFTNFYLKTSSWEIFGMAEQEQPLRPRRIS